ncbi:MAG: LysM peptidoglycan-binding domain-containing protein [Anaerolineae bacterium]|nr:LysM peptidoglycan-binding domain-containing protein [Anaerolineae bacterium]
MRTRQIVTFLLCVVMVGTVFGLPANVQAQGGNLLRNADFEGSFVNVGGDSTLRVAENWQPWYVEHQATDAAGINLQPEYKAAEAFRVHAGSGAQEYNTFFATHTGGIYQRVPVTPSTELQFSIFVYIWSSATYENPDISIDPNNVIVNVGIDPFGGTDGTSANVIWSADAEFYDEYRQLSVTATSQSTAVTVFVRTAPLGFVGTNNVYLDDAALLPLGMAATPTTPPTNTPIPTSDVPVPTQEGTVTPIPTIIPIATQPLVTQPAITTPTATLPGQYNSTVLYTVVAGDTVWEIARRFESTVDAIIDVNGLDATGFLSIGQTLVVPISVNYQQPATFTPVPTQAAGTGGQYPVTATGSYTVLGGDTLYSIARSFNTTVETLAQINNIVNPSLIYPGQVLTVANTAPVQATPTPVPVQATAVPQVTPGQHVVQVGENLFRIALRYNMTWDVLMQANGLYNPHLVFPGQILIIPQG